MSEFNDMEVGELDAKLRELTSVRFHAVDTDENTHLRHVLRLQELKLELQRRELESMQRERDEARARLAGLYDFTPIAYISFDACCRVREINLAGAALLGIEREQLRNTSFTDYLDEEDAARFSAHLTQVMSTGQRGVLDLKLHDFSGYCYDVRLITDLADAQESLHCLSAIIDLTEQKQIEQQIRRSGDFSRSILNALPAQIAVLDAAGTIIATNDFWRDLEVDERAPPAVHGGVGTAYLQWFRNFEGECFREAPLMFSGIQQVIGGVVPEFKLEYSCHSPTQKRWFLVWATPMAGNDGGAVIAHVDITTRILAQEEARMRGEALARASRLSSVGILASALAHEITQPLTAVGQFSSAAVAMLYSGDTTPQDLAEVLLHIDSEVQRAGEVMRRLRAFMGRGSTSKSPVELARVLDAAIAMISQRAAEKKINVSVDITDTSLGIVADQVQITQVLVNLICNSIEAIDRARSARRQVAIHCGRTDEGVYVRVCDTGPGLEPGGQETIFDLFETDNAKGTGMGLAISRSIIEDHGGRLWTEAEQSEGAVFHFTLPVMQEEMSVE